MTENKIQLNRWQFSGLYYSLALTGEQDPNDET